MSGSASLRSIRGFHAAWNFCFDVLMCLCVWRAGKPQVLLKLGPWDFQTATGKPCHASVPATQRYKNMFIIFIHPCRSLAILGRFTSCFSKFCCPWHKKTCPKFQECLFFCETDSTVRVNSETQLWHSSELVDCIDWNGSANKVRIWAFRYWALMAIGRIAAHFVIYAKMTVHKKKILHVAANTIGHFKCNLSSLSPFAERKTPRQGSAILSKTHLSISNSCGKHKHWGRNCLDGQGVVGTGWNDIEFILEKCLNLHTNWIPELVEMPLLSHPAWPQNHTAKTTAWQVWHVNIKFGQTLFHNYWCNVLVEKKPLTIWIWIMHKYCILGNRGQTVRESNCWLLTGINKYPMIHFSSNLPLMVHGSLYTCSYMFILFFVQLSRKFVHLKFRQQTFDSDVAVKHIFSDVHWLRMCVATVQYQIC